MYKSCDNETARQELTCMLNDFRKHRHRMRWGIAGGQAALTFRSLVISGRFDCAWERIMQARGRNGAANDNRNHIRQPLAA